jgi:hypothetical protein
MLAFIATFLPSAQLTAADPKPLGVFTLASVDSLMSDVDYLGQTLGNEQLQSIMAEGALKALTGGKGLDVLDRKKPIGIVLLTPDLSADQLKSTPWAEIVQSYLCLPVKSEEELLAAMKNYTSTPQDRGNGVKSMDIKNNQKTLFYKVQNGYMFVADKAEFLGNLPSDPTTLMGKMAKDYDIAVRLNIGNLPETLRKDIVDAFSTGVTDGLRRIPGEDDAAFEIRKGLVMNNFEIFESLVNDTDGVTVGLNIDSSAKVTYLDTAVTVKSGSKWASKFALTANVTSQFAGFFAPSQGISGTMSYKLDGDAVQIFTNTLSSMSTMAKKQIAAGNPKDGTEEIVDQFFEILTKTGETGRVDAAATIALGERSVNTLVAGYVHDGAAAESLFKKMAELVKDDVTEVKMDVTTHEGVKFHQVSYPAPGPMAQILFGETVTMTFGVGPKQFYLASGKDSLTMCKEAITSSALAGEKKVETLLVETSVSPILTFANSLQPNPLAKMCKDTLATANGKDHISVGTKAIENGQILRVQVDEVILKLAGTMQKLMMRQQQGPM